MQQDAVWGRQLLTCKIRDAILSINFIVVVTIHIDVHVPSVKIIPNATEDSDCKDPQNILGWKQLTQCQTKSEFGIYKDCGRKSSDGGTVGMECSSTKATRHAFGYICQKLPFLDTFILHFCKHVTYHFWGKCHEKLTSKKTQDMQSSYHFIFTKKT